MQLITPPRAAKFLSAWERWAITPGSSSGIPGRGLPLKICPTFLSVSTGRKNQEPAQERAGSAWAFQLLIGLSNTMEGESRSIRLKIKAPLSAFTCLYPVHQVRLLLFDPKP